MKRIILITGGQRSGKSSYAEKLALSLSSNPIYMATSRIWDEEFRQRVIKHQKRRGKLCHVVGFVRAVGAVLTFHFGNDALRFGFNQ